MLGIGVLCEAISPPDMPDFLLNTPKQLYELLRAVCHPNLQAQLDLYHMARQGLDIPAGLSLLAGCIGHVQFADCAGRGEPDTGVMEFSSLLAALRNSGYEGWLGVEYLLSGVTGKALEWLLAWLVL